MAPESLEIELRNNTDAGELYAAITGQSSNGIFLLSADGKTAHHPKSPSATLQPPGADINIKVGGPGKARTVTVPRLAGARIWFSKDKPLSFFINPGPALVEPSATNPSDANYEQDWGFAEFTLNQEQLYVNVSYVDFVSLPISLGLESGGKTRTVPGFPSDGLQQVANGLEKQGGGWERLVIKSGDGKTRRVLSPNAAGVLFPGLFDGYYKSYVDDVWEKYSKQDLTVNTQFTWGDVQGRVSDGYLDFGKSGKFAKPSAADIFSCSTGPFAHTPTTTDETLNIGARLAAAFNRSTLLKNSVQPEEEKVSEYYKEEVTNHYSRVCHEITVEGRGYAFPYDDVGGSKGGDQSGFLNDGNPTKLILSVGKPL